MPQLIKVGAVVEDRWTLARDIDATGELAPNVIVPLAHWLADAALRKRDDVGARYLDSVVHSLLAAEWQPKA